MLSLKIDRSVG
jgi:hypothetical protein